MRSSWLIPRAWPAVLVGFARDIVAFDELTKSSWCLPLGSLKGGWRIVMVFGTNSKCTGLLCVEKCGFPLWERTKNYRKYE